MTVRHFWFDNLVVATTGDIFLIDVIAQYPRIGSSPVQDSFTRLLWTNISANDNKSIALIGLFFKSNKSCRLAD